MRRMPGTQGKEGDLDAIARPPGISSEKLPESSIFLTLVVAVHQLLHCLACATHACPCLGHKHFAFEIEPRRRYATLLSAKKRPFVGAPINGNAKTPAP